MPAPQENRHVLILQYDYWHYKWQQPWWLADDIDVVTGAGTAGVGSGEGGGAAAAWSGSKIPEPI